MTDDPTRVLTALRQRLDELRAESQSTADTRRPVQLDQNAVGRLSRMDAMQVQAMALATDRRRQEETKRIEAAIRRIEEGEYGDCTACGDEIARARLDADPTVTACIRCAGKADT